MAIGAIQRARTPYWSGSRPLYAEASSFMSSQTAPTVATPNQKGQCGETSGGHLASEWAAWSALYADPPRRIDGSQVPRLAAVWPKPVDTLQRQ
jgi:hypothetical protein